MKLNIFGTVLGAALLCATPLSVQWSPSMTLPLSVSPATASAAELEVPSYRRIYTERTYRVRRHYRVASYDLFCGGPYVGPGWNGGTYWGGPWMDLRCYRVVDEVVVRALY